MTPAEMTPLYMQPEVVGGLATVVAAVIAVAGGSWAYRRQKNIDQDHELRKERRRVYQDFLTGLVPASRGDGEQHLRARLEAGLIGSTNVMRKLAPYNAYCDVTGPGTGVVRDSERYRRLLAEVLEAMREDVFDKTSIPTEEFSRLLPIK